jgi:hypothetical protein
MMVAGSAHAAALRTCGGGPKARKIRKTCLHSEPCMLSAVHAWRKPRASILLGAARSTCPLFTLYYIELRCHCNGKIYRYGSQQRFRSRMERDESSHEFFDVAC